MTTDIRAMAVTDGAATVPPALPGGPLGKDEFLRLLITQLRHQDPLNPLDQNQFLAQTAQFTSLEQLQAIRGRLDALQATVAGSRLTEAAALLGRSAKAAGREFRFDGVEATRLPFTVGARTSQVTVEILDRHGRLVRRLVTGPMEAGAGTVTWDGADSSGQRVAPGTYAYRVAAANGAAGASVVAVAAEGVLSGIIVDGDRIAFRMGDVTVQPHDLIAVS
jgi:flagellar basal-body rod modification protein FlgD